MEMAEELGPGAGRTAEPDVAVITERIAALDRHFSAEFSSLRELLRSQRAADALAVKTALDSAQELAQKHNDLIRQMERKDSTYATQLEVDRIASWQNKLAGGIAVAVAIGLTNLVKLWFT
jgi:hypothetical protein